MLDSPLPRLVYRCVTGSDDKHIKVWNLAENDIAPDGNTDRVILDIKCDAPQSHPLDFRLESSIRRTISAAAASKATYVLCSHHLEPFSRPATLNPPPENSCRHIPQHSTFLTSFRHCVPVTASSRIGSCAGASGQGGRLLTYLWPIPQIPYPHTPSRRESQFSGRRLYSMLDSQRSRLDHQYSILDH